MATWREKCGREPFSNNRTHYGRRIKVMIPYNERTDALVDAAAYMARLKKRLAKHGYTDTEMKLSNISWAGRGTYPAVTVRLLFDRSNPANSKM